MKKAVITGIIILFIIQLIPRFFCFNLTPSVPGGLYIRDFSPLVKGKYVRFKIDKEIKKEFSWIHSGYLLKQAVAVEGDFVSISRQGFCVNDQLVGTPLQTDSFGNALPVYAFHGFVPAGYLFAGGAEDSFDSRYFGPVRIKNITQFKKIF